MVLRFAILYALLFSAPVWSQDGFYPATTSTVTSLQKVIDAFNSLNNDPTTQLSFVPAAPPSGDTFLQGTGLGNSVLLKVKEFESNALPGINALFDGDSGCLAWNEDYASGINTPRRLYTLIHELIHNAVATNYPEFFAEIDTCSCAAPPPPDPDPCGDGPLDPQLIATVTLATTSVRSTRHAELPSTSVVL